MRIRTKSGNFVVPQEDEGYVVFSYPGGAFDIRVENGEVEVFIPRKVKQYSSCSCMFEILECD